MMSVYRLLLIAVPIFFACSTGSEKHSIIPPVEVNPHNHLAKVELNGKAGCIDSLGNEVVSVIYDDLGFWGDNLIAVNIGAKKVDYSIDGGKWGYCNARGKLTID